MTSMNTGKSSKISFKRHLWLCFFIACFFIFFSSAASVKGLGDVVPPSAAPEEDVGSIDSTIKALYQSITFGEGEKPDLECFRSLFHPKAHFIRLNPDGVDEMDLSGFISSFSQRVKSGQLKSFHESEISRKTEVYASIAQVFSTYQKGMNTKNPEEFICGINSIQLYTDGERWWIISITWQDEQPNNPIPERYKKRRIGRSSSNTRW